MQFNRADNGSPLQNTMQLHNPNRLLLLYPLSAFLSKAMPLRII